MTCPRCGFVLGPLENECPRCKAVYGSQPPPGPGYPPAPCAPTPDQTPRCPRCQQIVPAGYSACPRCGCPLAYPGFEMVPVRQRSLPVDIFLASGIVLYLIEALWTTHWTHSIDVVSILVTMAAYGFVGWDIWQNETRFGVVGYLITGWNLLWSVMALVFVEVVFRRVRTFDLLELTLELVILAGLLARYVSKWR